MEYTRDDIIELKSKQARREELAKKRAIDNLDKADEVAYKFKTTHGTMSVKPSDIIEALKEQSQNEDTELTTPREDMQGWSLMYGTDENGKSRPLLLMRVLPGPTGMPPYYKVEGDDKNMAEILMKDVYNLSPFRIKWIRFRTTVVHHITKLYEAFQIWLKVH